MYDSPFLVEKICLYTDSARVVKNFSSLDAMRLYNYNMSWYMGVFLSTTKLSQHLKSLTGFMYVFVHFIFNWIHMIVVFSRVIEC